MKNRQLAEFCVAWNKHAELFRAAKPTEAELRHAFHELQAWSIEQVEHAFRLHSSDSFRGHRMPTAIDLRRALASSPTEKRRSIDTAPAVEQLLKSDRYPPGFGKAYARAWQKLRPILAAQGRRLSYDQALDEFDDELTATALENLLNGKGNDVNGKGADIVLPNGPWRK